MVTLQPRIIAFAGQAGSGKDTAADILCGEAGYIRLSFAAPLKDALAAIFGWSRAALEGDTPESRAWREKPDAWWSGRLGRVITPRGMMQEWGTGLGRAGFHPDIWLASMERRLGAALAAGVSVVVTDCRFENEAALLRAMGAHIIHIERADKQQRQQHISEAGISRVPADRVLLNNGTLEEYAAAIHALLSDLYIE
jgi:hypothetical protein